MFKKQKKLMILILLIFQICLTFLSIDLDSNNYNRHGVINIDPNCSDIIVGNYTVPGVLGTIPLNRVLKIGLLDDMEDVSGIHAWNAAILAAKEINEAGGIIIAGIKYFIGLVSEDTDEANPILDTSKSVQAAETMVNVHKPHYIIGGFRTESLLAYQEVIMDAKIPFICTGASHDIFCQNVIDNYERYKYFFRAMPLNGTSLALELMYYYSYLTDYLNITYGVSTVKFGILREDLAWTSSLAAALQTYLPLINPKISVLADIAFPITLSPADMQTHLNYLESVGAQIVITIISSPNGILMSQQYASIQPHFLLAGINTRSQLGDYWDITGGSCAYEVQMQSIYNISKTFETRRFWKNFIEEYGEEPYYTGIGSYDAVRLLVNATIDAESFNSDNIVNSLEKIDKSNPFIGISSNIAFTNSHDITEGWPYGVSLFCQWTDNASKVVLSTGNSIYPDTLPTGFLKLPPWGIQGLGVSRLPGNFTLYSYADNPDTDGSFNLTWSNSNGADNYIIYKSKYKITYPNDGLQKILSAVSPFEFTNLPTGNHYFVVVASNGSGMTMSNCIRVIVQRPAPGSFLLNSDADVNDDDGNFLLIWGASDGADNYSVYASDHYITEVNKTLILLDQNALSPYSILNRKTGDHYFVVIAYNGTGQTMSNCIHVSVLRPAPGSFLLSSDAYEPDSNGAFNLMWSGSQGANNYSIYTYGSYITQINYTFDLPLSENAISPFPISGLSDGDYFYVVVAYNGTGETMSNCIHVSVLRPAPGNFLLSSDADEPDPDGAFNLTWTDSKGADNYSIYTYNSFITEINYTIGSPLSENAISPYPISGLSDGEYFYVVVAYNGTGETMSNCLKVTVGEETQELPPGAFSLWSNAGNPDTDGEFRLSWSSSEGADEYSIYKSELYITQINLGVFLVAENALSSYPISESENGDYYYVVVAYNEFGNTLSNCYKVTVEIDEGDEGGEVYEFIPGFNIFILFAVFGVVFYILVFKILKKTNPKSWKSI